jgi:hypothetical protein
MKSLFSFLTLLVSTALLCGSAAAQASLELAIEADPDRPVLGEPVLLLVSLRNGGKEPVEVARHLAADFAHVDYYVTPPGGEERRFRAWAIKDATAPAWTLAPGEALQDEARIFFGPNGWTFPEPGRYEVRAVYQGAVRSNRLVLDIEEPRNSASREAADLFLTSNEVGYFLLLEGGDHLHEAVDRLERVSRLRGRAPHAAAANLALGLSLAYDFADFTEGRLRHAYPEAAAQHLADARDGARSFHQALHSRRGLVRSLRELGEEAGASDASDELDALLEERLPEHAIWAREIRERVPAR